ncbi:MAG: hypothetical protein DYG96_04120 [Chlorobi bacterium CHB2]|nr:hypothetical protein [Chlorobi bacterium CHB2]
MQRRTLMMLAGLLLLGSSACDQDATQHPSDSTKKTAQPPPPPGSVLDIDTTSPNDNIATAPKDLAADSLMLRSPEGGVARYGVKSGRLVLRYGEQLRGERIVMFDDYGLKERIEDKFATYPPGAKGPIRNTMTIVTPEYYYAADPDSRTAQQVPNRIDDDYAASPDSKTIPFAEWLLKRQRAQHVGDTTINGYRCRIVQMQAAGGPVRWYLWRGIILREAGEFTQAKTHHILKVQEINVNVAIPDSMFALPAGYKVTAPPLPKKPTAAPQAK